MMGLLDMASPEKKMQQPQQQKMGGLLAMGGGMQDNAIPPEMVAIIEKIKMMQPEQKGQAIAQLMQSIESSNKPDMEKQKAIEQLMQSFQPEQQT